MGGELGPSEVYWAAARSAGLTSVLEAGGRTGGPQSAKRADRKSAMDLLAACLADRGVAWCEDTSVAACASRDGSTDDQVDGDGDSNSNSSSSNSSSTCGGVQGDGAERAGNLAPDEPREQSLYIEGEPILGVVVGGWGVVGGEGEEEEEELARPEDGHSPTDRPAMLGRREGKEKEDGGEGLWSSEEEDDVLQLEGIADHDHVAMLPANNQDDDQPDDDEPPALYHGASFGEEASSSLDDEDGADGGQYDDDDDYEDEDECQDQDEKMDHGSDNEDRLQAAAGESEKEGQRRAPGRPPGGASMWLDKFERLKAFQAKHGHPHVRQDELLGPWVCMQRRYYKLQKLLNERQQLLSSIGMHSVCVCVCTRARVLTGCFFLWGARKMSRLLLTSVM